MCVPCIFNIRIFFCWIFLSYVVALTASDPNYSAFVLCRLMHVCKNSKLIKIFHYEGERERKRVRRKKYNMKMKKLCVKYLIHTYWMAWKIVWDFMDDGLALLVGSFGKEEQYDARNTQKQLKSRGVHLWRRRHVNKNATQKRAGDDILLWRWKNSMATIFSWRRIFFHGDAKKFLFLFTFLKITTIIWRGGRKF